MFRFKSVVPSLRYFTTGKSVVFDIDGVLIHGAKAIPQAKKSLQLLDSNKIPFILLTNGGGYRESDRTKYLSQLIDYPFKSDHLVQSHTPMKTLNYNNVLVVGGQNDKSRYAALDYGFKNVVMPIDIVNANRHIAPHAMYKESDFQQYSKPWDGKPIDAIMVFNDPRDMGADLQIILDLLNSEGGEIGTRRSTKSSKPSIPIFFSNNDFEWSNEFPLPRFGQGVFRLVVETVYKEINGYDLERTLYGKPFKIQYDYIKDLIGGKVYMIGDNPNSDIEGANLVGWESCLLRTGVYRGEQLEPNKTPTMGIFDNVLGAVESIIDHKI
ncbi:uncharacterized protein CLIB1444_05S08108 [[Candida] jaroonii]|uniref:Uncharacterized protein n=1 Tax=[Candida] jaroonii TaxID=467808 RepID=A0ACA9YA55_9ASCO|nr:uncharacterized protein CLIB1444_05S08108 [[Candida] jaroonii]